ncbi:hypothetical protein Tco_1011200 [Tanacetum coccineum]
MEIDLVKMGNGCIMKYHISVVRGTGETLTLEVKSSDTVHDLKYSKLHLEFLRNWIKIFIKTVKEGNITGLEVKSSDTISMVKATTTSDWQVAKPNQRIQRKYQLGDFYAEPKRQPHFPCLIMEHLAKDEEKNVFCSINEEVRESLLNLKNTPYHSRQILYSIEYAESSRVPSGRDCDFLCHLWDVRVVFPYQRVVFPYQRVVYFSLNREEMVGWSFSLGLTLNSSKFCSRNVRGMWLGFGFSPILLFLLPLLFRRAKGRLLRLLNHIEHVCGQVDFVTSEVVLEQGRL